MNKNLDRFQLEMFLLMRGFRRPDFDCVKFSGGTQGDMFVGWVPYLVNENELFTIVVPYKRNNALAEKPGDESHFELLVREAKQETGIEVKTENLWECFRRVSELLNKDYDGFHEQFFYAGSVYPGVLKYLLSFSGYNKNDADKGRPILTKFRDAYRFLPTAHLDAAFHVIKTLIENIDNPFYLQGIFDKHIVLAHLTDLHDLFGRELRQRLRQDELVTH